MTESIKIQVRRFIEHCQNRLSQYLDKYLPSEDALPSDLHHAIRYSVLNGGKRLRPMLVYATGASLNAPLEYLDAAAAAVELMHCYSLVHDDLPAMDDATTRRGKPSCHCAFDEATAILVGDALQCLAFELIASDNAIPESSWALEMVKTLATASGAAGMVAGQALDIKAQRKTVGLTELENIHRLKTGALIRASIRIGALAAGASDTMLVILDNFANALGLAFQIQDDLLDLTAASRKTGKPQQQDNHNYASLLGTEKTKEKLHKLEQQALQALSQLDVDTTVLITLTKQLIHRDK